MTDFSLTDAVPYPVGATVKAYPVSNWPGGTPVTSAAPVGTEDDSQTMGASGLTFTGLDADTNYVAYALVGSTHRYVAFNTETESGGGGGVSFEDFATHVAASGNDAHPTFYGEINVGIGAALALKADLADLTAHADDPLLHSPAYGSATFSSNSYTAAGAAAYPSYGDIHASLQKTITADGTSPIVVELTIPGIHRDTAGSGTAIAVGIREGTSTPIAVSLLSVPAADHHMSFHLKTPPFVPTEGEHTYKACATYIGGGSDLMLTSNPPELKFVLEVLGRRTDS